MNKQLIRISEAHWHWGPKDPFCMITLCMIELVPRAALAPTLSPVYRWFSAEL